MRKVLIVDNAFLARCALKAQIAGFSDEIEIIETDSGEKAIEIYAKASPDMVFTDVVLNGTNGLVAARQIIENDPDAKIFIVTEYDYFSYAQEAISIGIKDYILKPAPTEKIYKLLRTNLPDVKEIDSAEERGERESESRSLEEMDRRMKPDAAGMHLFEGTLENSFLNKLMLNDMKAARKEGQQLLKGYYDRAGSVGELQESFIEFFVILNRTVKNLSGTRPNGTMGENVYGILQEKDKSTMLKKCMFEFDSMMSAMNESGVVVHNELRQRLVNYLNSHDSYNLSLEELSGTLGVSTTYLSRKFKDWMGSSFSTYMTNRRIEYAKKLLLTTRESVKSISVKAGYNDSNYFCRVFKKSTGQSPAFYRSLYR